MNSPSQLNSEGVDIVKRISGRQANKFAADSISQGLFSSHLLFQEETKAEENLCNAQKQQSSSYNPLRKRRQKKFTELSPLSGSQATPVFSSAKKEEAPSKIQQKKLNRLQQNESIVEISSTFYEKQSMECQKEKERQTGGQMRAQISRPRCLLENLLFFQEQDEQQKVVEQNVCDKVTVKLPEKCLLNEFVDSQEDNYSKQVEQQQEQHKIQHSEQQPSKYNQNIHKALRIFDSKSDFFTTSSIKDRKRQLCSPLQANQTLKMKISRNKDGLNMFWPEYSSKFNKDYDYVIAAKKISAGPTTTITISTTALDYAQNSQSYLGKLKSNIKGDVINLYSFGLSPSKAKQANQIPRELLATITFQKTQSNCPRQFCVYVKKPNFRYYLAFPQVKMYQQQLSLQELYHSFENRQKIEKYNNRRPTYSKEKKGYCLDFHGLAKISSIKNFILEKEGSLIDFILLGKNDEHSFNLEISGPISLLVGFAVALTAFEGKIFQS